MVARVCVFHASWSFAVNLRVWFVVHRLWMLTVTWRQWPTFTISIPACSSTAPLSTSVWVCDWKISTEYCLGLVVRRWAEPTHEKLLSSIRTVELGFENLGFWVFFILCSLINKRHVKILIVICEIHQFHLHFFTWCSSPSLTGDLSLVPCMGCFSCAFGSYFRVSLRTKNLFINLGFFQPSSIWHQACDWFWPDSQKFFV